MRRGDLAIRLVDVAVVAFAVWTVLYHLGLLLDLPTTALLVVWLVATAGVVALAARSTWISAVVAAVQRRPPLQRGRNALPVWAAVGAGAGAAISVAAGAWYPGLVLAALAVGCVAWAAPWRAATPQATADSADSADSRDAGTERPSPVAAWADLLAVLVAAGFAVFSQFIVRTDGDDTFYVNRSVWVAQHGRLPVGDVLYGEDRPVLPGGAPVASVEAFAGALARVLHLNAATCTYYLLLPAATFLAVLALWRLIRVWAPRRAVLCLLLAAVFLLWSGGSGASFGSFHLVRSWQGKAIFVSVLVPALYAYLSEWAQTRRRRSYLLALAAGVAGVGLTSTATFVVPLVAAGAGLGLLVRYGLTRWSFRDIVQVGLVAAYPVAAAVAVTALVGSPAGEDTTYRPADVAWQFVIGPGPLTLLGGTALWLGPFLVRRGAAAAVAWGASLVVLVLMVPGVLGVLEAASGSGPVLWRTLWAAPVPALVGLLAAVPLPHLSAVRVPRWASAAVPATAGVLVLVLAGTPVWANANRARLDSPQWKTRAADVAEVFAILRAYPQAKVVLAPSSVMSVLPLVTSEVKAVNPRALYTRTLTDGTALPRQLLSNLANRSGRQPTLDQLVDGLNQTDVDVVCLNRRDDAGRRTLQEAGFGGERRVGRTLTCLTPGTERPATPR
jgi:Family of unknown function (DUF6077)